MRAVRVAQHVATPRCQDAPDVHAAVGTRKLPDPADSSHTYSQLWMGTHPTLPSRTAKGTLKEHLAANPSFIGTSVTKRFPDAASGALPFLFKVLSIGTALSIQAHPNKTLAERLHKERPDVYKGAFGFLS